MKLRIIVAHDQNILVAFKNEESLGKKQEKKRTKKCSS